MKVAAKHHVQSTGSKSAVKLSAMSSKIASSFMKGMKDVVEKKYQSQMTKPKVSETRLPPQNDQSRGKTTMSFTVKDHAAAKAIFDGFGPMDDENLLTDNLNNPDGLDEWSGRVQGNKVILEATWSAPRPKSFKAVEDAFGMMSNFIMDSAKSDFSKPMNVAVITPQVKTTQNSMTLSYELRGEPGFNKLSAESVKHIAAGLKMDRASLSSHHINLPDFVQTASVKANGSHLVVQASW